MVPKNTTNGHKGPCSGQLAERFATVTKNDFSVDDGSGDREYISWRKVKYFIQGVEEVIKAKDQVAREALNDSETLKWILEEEKEKFRESFEEIAFLNAEIKKLSMEKSETLQKMQQVDRENANLKEQLVIAQLQLEHMSASPSPLTCSPCLAAGTGAADERSSDEKQRYITGVGVEKRIVHLQKGAAATVSPTALFHTPELVRDSQKLQTANDENLHYTINSNKID